MGALALLRQHLQRRPTAKAFTTPFFKGSVFGKNISGFMLVAFFLFFSFFPLFFSVLELTLAHFKSTCGCLISIALSDYLTLASTVKF
jgi:hypothetical protein